MSKEAKERARAAIRTSIEEMTVADDRAITESARADPDNPPADELLRRRGRPLLARPKEQVTIRLDADVLARLKRGGAGWQTRANAILRKAVGLE
jgi:uncharacterized protein (DUF4415 family)